MARYTIDFYSKSLLRRVKIQLIIPSLNLTQTLRNPDENYYGEFTPARGLSPMRNDTAESENLQMILC